MNTNFSLTATVSCIIILLLIWLNIAECLRVENLKEINKDAQSITIEWSINDIDLEQLSRASGEVQSDWIGFKIKYFTDKLQYTPILLKNINLRKFRLDNLKSNTEYKIQVSAYNQRLENEGPASNLLTVKTHEAGLFVIKRR